MAEIAGLALGAVGVLPVLAAVAKNYDIVFELFVMYRQCGREIKKFADLVQTERIKFQNESVIFERHKKGDHDIMITNAVLSSDQECEAILKRMNQHLEEIKTEMNALPIILRNNSDNIPFWSKFRPRMKLALTNLRREATIKKISKLNEDLRIINLQTIRTIKNAQLESIRVPEGSEKLDFVQHSIIQTASKHLYDILADTCCTNMHAKHSVFLDLLITENYADANSKVALKIGFVCDQKTNSQNSSPVWLKFESAPNDTKLNPLRPAGPSQDNIGNSNGSGPVTNRGRNPTSTAESANPEEQLGQETVDRICIYTSQTRNTDASGPCIDLLDRESKFRHLAYHNPKQGASQGDLKTLKEVLDSVFDGGKSLDWGEKFKLAQVLALTVLRFQSTSWLPALWNSNDICFFNARNQDITAFPHFRRFLNVDIARQKLTESNGSSTMSENPEILSLGIVLMELGSDGGFDENKLKQDLQSRDSKAVVDLRLKWHGRFNKIYDNLVDMCTDFDFKPRMTDVQQQQLRRNLLIEVINRLETCLKQYNTFQKIVPPLPRLPQPS